MVLVQKWAFFQFFFSAIKHTKMSLTILQNEKTPFQAVEKRTTKSRKIDNFHGFGLKIAIFPTFFLRNIAQENVFYDILERKNAFRGYKNQKLKSRKIHIFPWNLLNKIGLKMYIIPTFFLGNIDQENVFLRYSRARKRLSRL